MQRLLTLPALAVLCVACAQDTAHPGPAAGHLPLSALPQLPEAGQPWTAGPRSASAASINYTFDGDETLSLSPAASWTMGKTQIPSSPGSFEWAVFGALNGGAACLELDIDLAVSGGNAYVYCANYQQGGWELKGVFGGDSPAMNDIGSPQYFSPQGNQYFVVVAWNGATATVDDYRCLVTQPDTLDYAFAPAEPDTLVDLLTLASGNPALVMFDGFSGQIQFSYAVSTAPTASGDWLFSLIDTGLTSVESISAVLYNDRPVVLYTASGVVKVATTAVEVPGSSDWQVQVLETEGGPCSLAVVAGRLTAAYYESDIGDLDSDGKLGYMAIAFPESALDPAGSWAAYRAWHSDHLGARPAITELQGRPALAFPIIEDGVIAYGTSQLEQPAAPAEWVFYEMSSGSHETAFRLTGHSGRAALSFINNGSIHLWLPWLDQPALQSEWDFYSYVPVASGVYDQLEASGRASFAWVSEEVPGTEVLTVATNMLRLGFGLDQRLVWTPAIAEGGDYFGGAAMAEVGGHLALAYTVVSGAAAEVRYAQQVYE